MAIIISTYQSTSAQSDSSKGHTEHFVVGAAIGAGTSYFVYKKTDNKWKSWLIGTGTATLVGLTKELIDPSIGRKRSGEDFAYTALGGAIGASIVIPLKPKKKEIVYLY